MIDSTEKKVLVKDLYTNKPLDFFFRLSPPDYWFRLSRAASLESMAMMWNNKRNSGFFTATHSCPINSKRNAGRRGSYINHVIELGSFYHRIIPESIEKWYTQIYDGNKFSATAELSDLGLN